VKNGIYILILLSILTGCLETGNQAGQDASTVEKDTVDTVIQSPDNYEAISRLGQKLYPPEIPARTKRRWEAQLALAEKNFNDNPDSLENIIWYGRRLAYLYRYKDAIGVYSDGLGKHPDSYELLRHRGHRFISIRNFEAAISDLQHAAFLIRNMTEIEIEPDGQPNKINKPLSSTQFNIWYHLGLAHYLTGDLDKAISAYKKCLEVSNNDDLLVAATDWLYMTYRKTGNDEAANELIDPIKRRMKIIENDSYHRRILMYKGLVKPESLVNIKESNDPDLGVKLATQGYGVANWYLYNGEIEKATQLFEKIVEGNSWSAFGYIAAEVDLANLRVGGI